MRRPRLVIIGGNPYGRYCSALHMNVLEDLCSEIRSLYVYDFDQYLTGRRYSPTGHDPPIPFGFFGQCGRQGIRPDEQTISIDLVRRLTGLIIWCQRFRSS